MKTDKIQELAGMCVSIKNKLRDIQSNLPYGITKNDEAFIRLTYDLLNDN